MCKGPVSQLHKLGVESEENYSSTHIFQWFNWHQFNLKIGLKCVRLVMFTAVYINLTAGDNENTPIKANTLFWFRLLIDFQIYLMNES
jgi:hypothetical protein